MKLKKVAALGLATAMAFSVTACSSKPAETTAAAEETTAAESKDNTGTTETAQLSYTPV